MKPESPSIPRLIIIFFLIDLALCIAHIIDQVKTLGLNRVVVASCTPLTHEPLFQDAIRQAGVDNVGLIVTPLESPGDGSAETGAAHGVD